MPRMDEDRLTVSQIKMTNKKRRSFSLWLNFDMHSVERNVQLFAGFLFVHCELGQVARALFHIVVFPLYCILVWSSSCCLWKLNKKGPLFVTQRTSSRNSYFISKEEYIFIYLSNLQGFRRSMFGGHVWFDERRKGLNHRLCYLTEFNGNVGQIFGWFIDWILWSRTFKICSMEYFASLFHIQSIIDFISTSYFPVASQIRTTNGINSIKQSVCFR